MTDETRNEIKAMVRSGFYSKDELLEMFCNERYEPGELDPKEVRSTLDSAWDDYTAEQREWPVETDCDRLDRVFASLNSQGIIALQKAGYTQSDGYDDVTDVYHKHKDREKIIGYCFYQEQDLERAVEGDGLFLAFGPMDPTQEESHGPAVGKHIVQELANEGLKTQWNGTFAQRIRVVIDWKRRNNRK